MSFSKRAVLRSFLFLIALLFWERWGIAQGVAPKFKVYPTEVYQAHHQVYGAVRGKFGDMWFATSDNLLHFTGEEWEKIHLERGVPFTGLDKDRQGRIWVGGQKEFGYIELLRPLDKRRTRKAHRERGSKEGKGRSYRYVSLTERLPDSLQNFGMAWSATTLGERVFFNTKERLFVYDSSGFSVIYPRTSFFRVHSLNGALWVHDKEKGIYRIPKGDLDLDPRGRLPQSSRLPGTERFNGMNVVAVLDRAPALLEKGEVLIVTGLGGVYRYQHRATDKDDRGSVRSINEELPPFFKKALVNDALVLSGGGDDRAASLVLSTRRKGIVVLDSNGRIHRRYDQRSVLPSDYIWESIKGVEKSGRIWSMTNNGIVAWYPGDPRRFLWEGEGFSGGVNSIAHYRGRKVLATNQGVFYHHQDGDPLWDPKEEWVQVPGIRTQSFDMIRIGGEEVEEQLLLGGGSSGLILFDGPIEKERPRRIAELNSQILSRPLSYGKDRYLVVGGREGLLFLRWSGERKKWLKLLRVTGLPAKVLSMETSWVQEEGGKGRLSTWVSFVKADPIRLRIRIDSLKDREEGSRKKTPGSHWKSIREGKFAGLSGIGPDASALPEDGVPLFTRLKGHIAVGTDSGLYRLDRSDTVPRFVPDHTLGKSFAGTQGKKRKEDRQIFHLKERGDGVIWGSVGDDLFRWVPTSSGYKVDSFPFKEIGLGALRDIHFPGKGREEAYFAGNKGVMQFKAGGTKDFGMSYPCKIQEVSVLLPKRKEKAKEQRDSSLFAGLYRKKAPNDGLLPWKPVKEQPDAAVPVLPYDMNALTFRFSAPFFEEQGSVRYRYHLKGFETRWSSWNKITKKEYTNLPEGEYCFKVEALNVFGKVSRTAAYRFRILPPWYRTWPAYGAYAGGGVLFVWLLVWLNSKRLVAQKRKLEGVIRERTQEIQTEKEKVERAHSDLQVAHQEITESIDYAQKIQEALLRPEEEEEWDEGMPHFILFKPMAKVSGDFFWSKEHKGCFYIAAVDCTGHGVPGAFMSMLGASLLNQILATEDLPSPGEVLTELRRRVVRELSGKDPENVAKDGMDAALVKIPIPRTASQNDEEVQVEFAGAQNPLYVVREGIGQDPKGLEDLSGLGENRLRPFKNSSNGIEIKGDPMPVGYDERRKGNFTSVSLQLRKGDMLYIFSDGFADQFGGPKGKKFRYGPFKKLLADIHNKPLEDQKEVLDRTFEGWRAESGYEQIDDVLVIGVRL